MIRAAMLGLLGLAGLGLVGACSGEETEGGACAVDADCEGANECTSFTCKGGACRKQVADEGKPVYAGYVAGDCKRFQCGPGGTIVQSVDKNDAEVDPNPCTENNCSDTGVKGSTSAMDGKQCGASNLVTCKAGACTGCTTDKDCMPLQSPCHTATCSATGVCEYALAIGGTQVSDFDTGDCYKANCDASGKIEIVPLENGAQCGDSNTCSPKKCMEGVCVAGTPPEPGTPSSADLPGDCHSLTCDGMGGTVDVIDQNDAPMDENKADCVKPGCVMEQMMVVVKDVADVGNQCVNAALMPSMCDASGVCP